VAPRASRSALIAASVPEPTSRTLLHARHVPRIASASSISRSVGAPKRSLDGALLTARARRVAVAEDHRPQEPM
jgi:hypothetical protein